MSSKLRTTGTSGFAATASQIDWPLFLGGALTFVVLHGAVVVLMPMTAVSRVGLDGWWLNAVETLVAVGLGMSVASWLVLRRHATRLTGHAIAWALGAMAAMTVTLAVIGPGNIWPIVLVVGSVVLGLSVAVGAALAAFEQRSRA